MKSFFHMFLGALCALLFAPLATASPLETTVWIEVARDEVMNFNGNRLPRASIGMGTAMPERDIFTAAHVVWGAQRITVTDSSGAKHRAIVVGIDKELDAAVLRVERELVHTTVLRTKPVVTGEAVSVVGLRYADEEPILTQGNIASATWTSHGIPVPLIHSGIKGEKGMSGGGLFDASGNIVGVVVRVDNTLGYLSVLPITTFCKRFDRCASVAGK